MAAGFKSLSSKDREDSVLSNKNDVSYEIPEEQEEIGIKISGNEEEENKKEEEFEQLQLEILVFLYIEKFAETVLVFLMTAAAIYWKPMRDVVELLFWPLLGYVLGATIMLTICYRIKWFRQSPGFLLYKLLYLLFLIAVFQLLAIHLPAIATFLSPYYALVAVGTIGATYIFFAFITVTHKHLCKVHANGYSLWFYGLLMPIGILLVNQPIYLYGGVWHSQDYRDFMLNIGAGIILSLIFSYETLYVYQRFVASSKLEEFLDSPWLLPGFVTVYFANRNRN